LKEAANREAAAIRIQAYFRGRDATRVFNMKQQCALWLQARCRGGQARAMYGRKLRAIIRVQAAERGRKERRQARKNNQEFVDGYRTEIVTLWEETKTSLRHRSNFWVSFNQGRFLDVAVHKDEIYRLKQQISRERRGSTSLKKSLLSLGSAALFSPGGSSPLDPSSLLLAERSMLYAGIGEHIQSNPDLFSDFCRRLGVDESGKNRKKQLSELVWAHQSGEGAGNCAPEKMRSACDASAEVYLFVLQQEAEARRVLSPPTSPFGDENGVEASTQEALRSPGMAPEGPSTESFATERHMERVRRDLLYAVRAGLSSLSRDHDRKASLQGELYEAQNTIRALQRQIGAMEAVMSANQGVRYADSDSSGDAADDSDDGMSPGPGNY